MSEKPISDIPNAVTGGLHFELLDYIVLVVLLLASLGIGIYYGYFDGKEKTLDEYLLGGRTMKPIPIAISLVASQMSAFVIIGVPAELYSFGSHYMFMVMPTLVVAGLVLSFIVVPMFYANNLDNCYAYLELRFSKSVRNLVTFAFFVTTSLYLPVGSFVAALVMSTVTGLNVHVVNAAVSAICVTYTIMGGVKAVVWTDVIQAFVMVLSTGIIFALGVIRIGGINEVYQRNVGQRLLPPIMTLDFETRQTFWNILFGFSCTWVTYIGLNQVCVQRIVSLPTVKQAKTAIYLFCGGVLFITVSNSLIGTLMYAQYFNCDPVRSGKVSRPEKMVPYYVHDILGHLRGMSGLFISCVLSASLSTVAANLNSIAGIIYKDYVSKIKRFHPTHANARCIMYVIILLAGIYSVLIGIVVEAYDSLFQVITTSLSVTQGAVCGTFLLGMLFPRANHKAVFWAALTSMFAICCLMIGSQIEMSKGWSYRTLPTSIDGCQAGNITETIQNKSFAAATNDSFSIFKISFQWYSFFGAIIVWIVGIPLSYIIGPQDLENLNVNLISPVARFLLPARVLRIELKQCNRTEETLGNAKQIEKTYIVENSVVVANRGHNQG